MMKYSEAVFEKTAAVLEERRRKAENEQQQRLLEISTVAPEVGILQRNLRNTGLELVKLIMQGGEDTKYLIESIKEKNLSTQQTIEELLEAIKGDRHYLDAHYYCEKCNDRGFSEGRRCSCMEELLKRFTVEELNKNCLIGFMISLNFLWIIMISHLTAVFRRMKKCVRFREFCKDYAENFSLKVRLYFSLEKPGLERRFYHPV